ncbi:MAG TPA: glycosyltransferase [Candidatus Acidoferrum sp.]|nr:glycosyltransferase [Candidatus Acidoferrum sp.]
MNAKIITTIPTFNNEAFLEQTLASVSRQTRRPDRVIVLDDGSTDRTAEIVRNFKQMPCEFIRNPSDPGLFQNFNRCLEFAGQTEYLQILHADDVLAPEFYEVMTRLLADCAGRGLAWSLDERIDEDNRHLSPSGKPDGQVETLSRDDFLKRKAELGNQAFCATLLKTAGQPAPCKFPLDYPILGDTIFWAAYGAHCRKLVHIRRLLAQYRWHGANQTTVLAPDLQPLILDEWRTMATNEALRGRGWSLYRKAKLKGLLAVRSGIKAKRVRQNGDPGYSREIARAARGITGWPLWLAGRLLVELRDFYLFTVLRRTRHPKNIYS